MYTNQDIARAKRKTAQLEKRMKDEKRDLNEAEQTVYDFFKEILTPIVKKK